MKNSTQLKTLLFAFILSLTSFVAISHPGTKPKATTEKTISRLFKFPGILIPYLETKTNKTLKVEVLFVTNIDGNVTYVDAKTTDLKLKQEIEKQFYAINLSKVKPEVAHSIVLNFKIN